jgi:hypothetical protein
MKKFLVGIVMTVATVGMAVAGSQYASDVTTNTAVNFGKSPAGYRVKCIQASSGINGSTISVYGRTAASPYLITGTAGSSITNLYIANTGIAVTNGDLVIYQKKDGTATYHTIQDASSLTNCVITPALTGSVTTNGDYLFELKQIGYANLGNTNTSGVAVGNYSGDNLFQTPSDSPLRVLLTSGSNSYLSVTAE